ncbi:unnamed protein product [Blepharisma stoltei]|uniref:RNA helicase n=1 Tax=Blepharisma stoltei TaxID=1481888 RepID=A0AAU9J8D5_9CILI|nr:unnamed protein product [Blepharisma stoltei]
MESLIPVKRAREDDSENHEERENIVNRLESIQKSRKKLPILYMEQEIMESIKENTFTLICGETGSGKSTQVPQFLYEADFSSSKCPGKIGITQPRRIAAISLAQRVANELNLEIGKEVGYQIRYDASTINPALNKIKFMTDGILLREIEGDFLLSSYSAIIIDEAHERSINTDILLGFLSRIAPLRAKKGNPLKVVIMSATLRISDFTENTSLFPSGAPPVIHIESRQFPVTVHFSKTTSAETYLDSAFEKTLKIHTRLPEGGILIFVTSKKDVTTLKKRLKTAISKEEAVILGLYSMLPYSKQKKIFSPPSSRRMIVVSTNVSETSLTIPGIKYVVDTGLEKRKVFSGNLKMSKYVVTWISKASAEQRSGRAGRVSAGHCYRLYSNAAYGIHFEEYRPPEILNLPISSVILQLKSIGIRNVEQFPFPTCPDRSSFAEALNLLDKLGSIKQCRKGKGDVYDITDLGRKMAEFPISPRFSKMLILSDQHNIVKWMCILVALLEIEQVFKFDFEGETAKESVKKSKEFHAKWFSGESDLLCGVKAFLKFIKINDAEKEDFCEENHLNYNKLKEVEDLSMQLLRIYKDDKTIETNEFLIPYPHRKEREQLLKCLISGFIDQVATKIDIPDDYSKTKRIPYTISTPTDTSIYPKDYAALGIKKDTFFIHPSSYLYGSYPSLIVYQHLLFTKRPYMIGITKVKQEWLDSLQINN